jgi:hypothetical protein
LWGDKKKEKTMGSPMTGEIYEGNLRPGDIGLSKEEADRLKGLTLQDRMAELKEQFRKQDTAQAAADSGVSREMPRYKCHKEVWALKIAEIRGQSESIKPTIQELEEILARSEIVPADEGFAPFPVDAEYMRKHKPQVGGYFVVYKDGYKSYSPAQAFEEGYARIP